MIFLDQITCFLRYHYCGCISISSRNHRHNTGVYYPQVLNAIQSQSAINYSLWIGARSHFIGSHGVVNGLRIMSCHALPKVIGKPLKFGTPRNGIGIQRCVVVPHYFRLSHFVAILCTLNLKEDNSGVKNLYLWW